MPKIKRKATALALAMNSLRLMKLGPKRRKEIAAKAAQARWDKNKAAEPAGRTVTINLSCVDRCEGKRPSCSYVCLMIPRMEWGKCLAAIPLRRGA